MTKVTIAITFLIISAQQQYGLGINRNEYRLLHQIRSRIGTFPRPSLEQPSRRVYSFSSSSHSLSDSSSDFFNEHKRAFEALVKEADAMMRGAEISERLPSSKKIQAPPPSCSAGELKPSIEQYRTRPSLAKSPSFKTDDYLTPKVAKPMPPSKLKTPSLSKSPSFKVDDYVTPKVVKPMPPSKPDTTPETPKPSDSKSSSPRRSNSGSLNNKSSGELAVISEKLPNDGGTIDIRISGREIFDERLSQMIKEAKNAITAVFYGPLYDTTERGEIIFKDRPPSQEF